MPRNERGWYLMIHTVVAGRAGIALLQSGRVQYQRQKRRMRSVRAAGVQLLELIAGVPRRRRGWSGVIVARGLAAHPRFPSAVPPAGFSQLRSGIVTANAVGYALGIPVRGITVPAVSWRQSLGAVVTATTAAVSRGVVIPAYAKAPHITRSKKLVV